MQWRDGLARVRIPMLLDTTLLYRSATLLGFWPKPRGERSQAFLYLSVCGQNRGVKGPRPSFTSRFVAKTEE